MLQSFWLLLLWKDIYSVTSWDGANILSKKAPLDSVKLASDYLYESYVETILTMMISMKGSVECASHIINSNDQNIPYSAKYIAVLIKRINKQFHAKTSLIKGEESREFFQEMFNVNIQDVFQSNVGDPTFFFQTYLDYLKTTLQRATDYAYDRPSHLFDLQYFVLFSNMSPVVKGDVDLIVLGKNADNFHTALTSYFCGLSNCDPSKDYGEVRHLNLPNINKVPAYFLVGIDSSKLPHPRVDNPIGAIPLEFDLGRYAVCAKPQIYRLYSILVYQPKRISKPYRLHYWHSKDFKFIEGKQKGFLSKNTSVWTQWESELRNLQGQFVIFKLEGPSWSNDGSTNEAVNDE